MFVQNSFNKFFPFAQTETAAQVIDKKSELELLYPLTIMKEVAGVSLHLLFEAVNGKQYELFKKSGAADLYADRYRRCF